jgi:RNA polymerase sigma factor (sigma-70 family)
MAKTTIESLFTELDYRIVRAAMRRLPPREFKILFLRFWGHLSISEIARELRMSFDSVDHALSVALGKLKESCLKNPGFSRYQALPLAA